MRAMRFTQSVRDACLPQSNWLRSCSDVSNSTADSGGFVCGSFNDRLLREQLLQGRDNLRWSVECFPEALKLGSRQFEMLLVRQSQFSRAACALHNEAGYLLASPLCSEPDQALLVG